MSGTAYAQTAADVQNKYGKYINLFSGSTLTYSGPLLSSAKKTVTGLQFIFSYKLNGNADDAWKYVASPKTNQEQFILEACLADKGQDGTEDFCIYSKIPYAESPSAGTTAALKRVFSWLSFINPTGAAAGLLAEAEYGAKLTADQNSVRVIFKKDADGKTISGRDINIMATDWMFLRPDGTTPPYENSKWLQTKKRIVSVWYCGAQVDDTTNPQGAAGEATQAGLTTIKTIGRLCGETSGASQSMPGAPTTATTISTTSFFKVAQTEVLPPQSLEEATKQNASIVSADPNATKTDTGDGDTNLPVCSIGIIGENHLIGCLARIVYYGIYWPIAWIAGLFGTLFDFFIGYSVSDESYRMSFAVTGWKLVRDIANIFFIIIMVYTGFAAVFSFGGKGGATMRRIIPFLIINALIINFSLFATRTVIDISNITARVFYSRMIVCDGPCGPNVPGTSIPENVKRSPLGGHWPLSEKIVASFDPQRMFGPTILNPKETVTGAGNPDDRLENKVSASRTAEQQVQAKGFAKNSDEYAGYYALVSLIAAVIMAFIGIMFFKVMFMFLGRVMGLYVAMIFSPFAFLTMNGAGGAVLTGKMDLFEWNSWAKDLFNYAALAPVFTFMLYIVYSFLNTNMVQEIGLKDETGGFFGTVLLIAVPMLIIYFLIDICVQTAKKFSGKFGDFAQKTLTNTIGLAAGGAIGLAGGAVAMAGTGLGARAGKALGGTKLGAWAANNADSNRAARFFNNTLSKTQTGSWDFRKTKLNNLVNKGVNVATGGQVALKDVVSSRIGLGSEKFKGGAVARLKTREKELKEEFENKIQYAHLSEDRVKELWDRRQNKKASELAMEEHASATDTEYKAASDEVDAKKKELETKRKEIADAKRRLSVERSTLTDDEKTTLRNTVLDGQKIERATKEAMLEAKAKKKARLAHVTATTDKNDASYQSKVADAITKQKEEDAKTYGDIKNNAQYTNAMRRDYVEDKRNNSVWMKDGEQRAGMFGLPLGGGVAGVLAGLSSAVGLGAGSIIADRIKFEQEAFDNATQAYMKDYGKKGKDSKTEKLNKKIKEYEDTIKNSVKSRIKTEDTNNGINRTDAEIEEEIKNMDAKIKEKHFNDYINAAQEEYDFRTTQYKKAEQMYYNNEIGEDDLKMTSRERKKAEDALNNAKNAKSNKEKAETDLEKEGEKNKPKDKPDDKEKDKKDKDK